MCTLKMMLRILEGAHILTVAMSDHGTPKKDVLAETSAGHSQTLCYSVYFEVLRPRQRGAVLIPMLFIYLFS